jgi:hypothetical protein
MKSLVETILPMLDAEEDALLIGLLSQKIDVGNYGHPVITDRDIEVTKRGLKKSIIDRELDKVVFPELLAKDDKINKIIKRQECEKKDWNGKAARNCKHAIYNYREVEHRGFKMAIESYFVDEDSVVCESCWRRYQILSDLSYNIGDKIYKHWDDFFNSESLKEIINTKAMIHILNRKLREYKLKQKEENYATS